MLRLNVVAVVALAFLCCLVHHASTSAAGLRVVRQEIDEAPASLGANDDQAVVVGAGEEAAAEEEAGGGRMDLELEDYQGSGANDRHSPWGMQRRN